MAISILDLYQTEPKPREYVIPGLLPGRLGSIVSPGGLGKSMMAIQLCHLVAGVDTLNFGQYPTGRAVYLSAEDSQDILHERFFSIGSRMNQGQRELGAENIILEDLTAHTPDLFKSEWLETIEKFCIDSRVLFIDTLRSFHSGDENDGSQMAVLVGNLRAIASKTGCAIVFLHHANKASMGGQGDEQQASRGSSVLTDNLRWQAFMVGMSREESNKFSDVYGAIGHDNRKMFVRFGLSKQNYGSPLKESWFKRGEGGVLIPIDLIEAEKTNGKKEANTEKNKEWRNGL